MIAIIRYSADKKQEWDDFVRRSKNGTFLFLRDYMDYHADRFKDHSLMFYYKEKLLALLPANESSSKEQKETGESCTFRRLCSHAGLTYGGLVMGKDCTAAKVCELFQELMDYIKREDFKEFIYKPVPHIYHKQPAEEDLYALMQVCGAQLWQRSISFAIDLDARLSWRKGKRANLIAALRDGVTVMESEEFAAFWPILSNTLQRKFGTMPVHNIEEIELLHSRFPNNIRLLLAQKEEKILGGAVLYITDTCIHAQYLCSSEEGERLHSNEALLGYILNNPSGKSPDVPFRSATKAFRYFDYGISTEDGGRYLNVGLASSKEGFGCRGIVHDTYLWLEKPQFS